MSDVSKTNDLIAEKLREAAKRADWYQTGEAKLLDAAADALEAATSGPSGDGEYLLSVIETIKQTGGSVEIHGVKIMPCDEFGRTAAVPDAATEGDYHEGLEEGIKIGRAERDAALAAIERVRAIHERDMVLRDYCSECSDFGSDQFPPGQMVEWPCPTVAALDGAPEPEAWHYGRSWKGTRLEDECPCAKQPCGLVTLADAETVDCGQHAVKYSKTMRQSHSSSNCPGKPHDEHVKVTECWPMGCIEGDCEHRDEFGEPEGLESCPRTPMEVCVECMVSMGGGSDPTRWEEHLAPWPCSKTVRLPVEGESKP